MKLAFFSSSAFVIPILESIFDNQGQSLLQIAKTQLETKLETQLKPQTQLQNNISSQSETPEYKTIFGEIDLASQTQNLDMSLLELLNSPVELSLIISQPDQINRSKVIPNPITTFAISNNIPIINPESFNESRRVDFDPLAIDIGVTASFGQYISKESLESTNYGFINWHPSLLPKYRGATPIQMTLLSGDKEGGISWIDMTPKMDEGNIYLQISKLVHPQDNFSALSKDLGIIGSKTWAIAILNKLTNNFQVQDNSKSVLCSKLDKEDKYVDLKTQTASQILNQFRAYIEFPFTVIPNDNYFRGDVKILDCSISQFQGEEFQDFGNWRASKNGKRQIVLLKCADNTWLEVSKIQLATGKQIDFSGYNFG
jgi:methionyl-tRNA formyltransferase